MYMLRKKLERQYKYTNFLVLLIGIFRSGLKCLKNFTGFGFSLLQKIIEPRSHILVEKAKSVGQKIDVS